MADGEGRIWRESIEEVAAEDAGTGQVQRGELNEPARSGKDVSSLTIPRQFTSREVVGATPGFQGNLAP